MPFGSDSMGNNKYSEEAFDQFLIKTWSFCRIQGKNFNRTVQTPVYL